MNGLARLSLLAAAVCGLAGCLNARSYPDPQYHREGVRALTPLDPPLPVLVQAQFFRNGEPLPQFDAGLRNLVEQTLRGSGRYVPATDIAASGGRRFRLSVNDTVDVGGAIWKGVGTGFTFGLAGNTVTDAYDIRCTTVDDTGVETTTSHPQLIRTTLGDAAPPLGQAYTETGAVNRVLQDAVLDCVRREQDATIPVH